MSGQQLGMHLLEEARLAGAMVMSGRVTGVSCARGEVEGVTIISGGVPGEICTRMFVNAAGPHAKAVGLLADMALPLFSEAHYTVSIEDTAGAIDRNTGLVILDDPQQLEWSDKERAELAADTETRRLTELLPAGIHLRPEGYGASRTVLMLWDYHGAHRFGEPLFPMAGDPLYPEVVLRGMIRLAPALAAYLERLPATWVDGGYYTKTSENRPLIGAAGARGAYAMAGFSGFGLMAAPAAAELLAAEMTDRPIRGSPRASYAAAFAPSRFDDASYRERALAWGSVGQL